MQVRGRRQAEQTLQVDLARGVVGEVFAAHHVRDALGRIVDDHRELVRPQAVRAAQHEVADRAAEVLPLRAESPVGPVDDDVCCTEGSAVDVAAVALDALAVASLDRIAAHANRALWPAMQTASARAGVDEFTVPRSHHPLRCPG